MKSTVHYPTVNTSSGEGYGTEVKRERNKNRETDRWERIKVRDVEKRMKQNKRKEDTERKETKTDLLTRTWKERSTSLSHFCLPLSTKSFLPLLFLVVLVCLTLSCPLTLPCFLCVCVCVCQSHGVLSGCQAQSCHTLTEPAHPSPALSL